MLQGPDRDRNQRHHVRNIQVLLDPDRDHSPDHPARNIRAPRGLDTDRNVLRSLLQSAPLLSRRIDR